jgi:ABC transport permease subunit
VCDHRECRKPILTERTHLVKSYQTIKDRKEIAECYSIRPVNDLRAMEMPQRLRCGAGTSRILPLPNAARLSAARPRPTLVGRPASARPSPPQRTVSAPAAAIDVTAPPPPADDALPANLGPAEPWHHLVRGVASALAAWKPPRYVWRSLAALILGGEVMVRILQGKIHFRNTLDQLNLVGPRSLGVCLLTAAFVGMVFTIQFIREFAKLGLTRSVGGVLALALSRELTPVVTSIIVAGRVGSAFAAELGTMQVSEQTDSLRVLGSDPVDYLITPRVLACMIAGPVLNLMCFCMGMAASVLLADAVYDVPANVILDSACRAVAAWDVVTSMIKCWVFGTIISVVSCSWGYTTSGGAKGVGESTTSAVVISLVLIFVADFLLSFLFFQGQGDALRQCV